MTVTFSFDHALTPEELAAVNELHRLANGQKATGEAVRQAVKTPTPTNNATIAPPAPERHGAPEPTEADVRRAIDEAKSRIWGAGHATDPALTKEQKAPLVEAFRTVAKIYGAEKPSQLATPTARANFIRHISTLELDADGNIVEGDLPF